MEGSLSYFRAEPNSIQRQSKYQESNPSMAIDGISWPIGEEDPDRDEPG